MSIQLEKPDVFSREEFRKPVDLGTKAFELAQDELATLLTRFPEYEDMLVGMRGALRRLCGIPERKKGASTVGKTNTPLRAIRSLPALFEVCPTVDREIIPENCPLELRDAILESRERISASLIQHLYDEQMVYGDVMGQRKIREAKNLAVCMGDIVPFLQEQWEHERREKMDFDQHWITRSIGPEKSGILRRLITTNDTGVERWEKVKDLMPAELARHFVISLKGPKEEEVIRLIQEYRKIAESLGADALAQFIISSKGLEIQNLSRMVGLISEHLGRCATRVPKPEEVMEYPEALIQHTGVRELIFINLRNYLYQRLTRDGYDDRDAESHRQRLSAEREKIENMLQMKVDVQYEAHRKLLQEVLEYFDQIMAIDTPDRMLPIIRDANGESHFIPSLRQKIAMEELRRDRRKLIAFFMGKGKTASAFLAKEYVGARKMLYICPPALVNVSSHIQEQVRRHYKEGQEPTVGVISTEMVQKNLVPEMKQRELEKALEAEIVVLPYSMFGSEVNGKKIVDYVRETKFDFVTVDEIQNVRNERGRDTKTVSEIVQDIEGLTENGYLALLSAEPMPSKPDDITPQLKLLDPNTYGQMSTLREVITGVDPLRLRNTLLKHILVLDEPIEWEQYIHNVPYDLSPEESRLYAAIILSDHLETTQKLQLLSLFLKNTTLLDRDITPTLVSTVIRKAEELLQRGDAIMIVENENRDGILRPHGYYEGPSVFERLVDHFSRQGVEVLRLDGLESPEHKRSCVERSRTSEGKTILVCMRECIGEGLDNLHHIKDMIILEPWYNLPDIGQMLFRGNRRLQNGTGEIHQCVARNTLHEGILAHASYKRELVKVLLRGGIITPQDLEKLENAEIGQRLTLSGRRVLIGTHILRSMATQAQQLQMHMQHLYGKGEAYMKEYLEEHSQLLAKLYTENWPSSFSGNNARFVTGLLTMLEDLGDRFDRVADLACGNLVLENTWGLSRMNDERTIISLDLNGPLMEAGKRMLEEKRPGFTPRVCLAGMSALPHEHFPSGAFDLVNISLALPYTRTKDTKNKGKDERVRTLCEANRIEKEGGKLVMTLSLRSCTREEFENFTTRALPALGFRVIPEFTGIGASTDDTLDHHFENYTIVCEKISEPDLNALDMTTLKFSRVKIPKKRQGIQRMTRNTTETSQGHVHSKFQIRGWDFEYKDGLEEMLSDQARLDQRVRTTQEMLFEVYQANGNSLDHLGTEMVAEIRKRGIQLIPIFVEKKTLWCFSFMDGEKESTVGAWPALPREIYQKVLKVGEQDQEATDSTENEEEATEWEDTSNMQ